MKKSLCSLFALYLLAATAMAASDAQRQAIESLGQLNGVALQCRQTAEMQRMKQAMVDNLPKQRLLGEWFDAATNSAFLDFARNGGRCPAEADFRQRVDQAIEALKQAFARP